MVMLPLPYVEPVFRPPSEAQSLIIQVTVGCSYNKCTFCDMYTLPQKKFRVQDPEEIERQIKQVAASGAAVESIFLGDGDAMTLSMRRLEQIVDWINQYLPGVKRISSYCLPRNLKGKSVEDLTRLRSKGLDTMYVGLESGDDQVLALVQKGETFDSSLEAMNKIKQSGLRSEAFILNGLGGTKYTEQHARNSARLLNESKPDVAWTLALGFFMGRERFEQGFDGDFEELDRLATLKEQAMLIEALELDNTLFRTDHASNYLPMQGVLGRDKFSMLRSLHGAIEGVVPVKEEWQRGW